MNNIMKEQLLTTLENSRRYTLAVVEAMPEKSYLFKPAEAVWTFKELADHIAYGILWWEDNYIKGTKTDWNPPAVKNTKQQVIEYLTQAYDSLKSTVQNSKLNESSVNGFHATLDHITHHRGQAVTYLRCQGITPPEYTY
jgi:uncharacterized damage-inducible protein DinB